MAVLSGVNHATFLTSDLDRLALFYEEVFRVITTPTARPMLERGRIDHFALGAVDAETFERLRADLVARGHTDGAVTDFGVMRVLTFNDPDGHAVELAHWVGGVDPTDLDMSRATDDERTV